MSKIYNLVGSDEAITFNIGDYSLEFHSSDEKSKAVSDKAIELKEKAENISNENEWEARKEIKNLLDEFFAVMFDEEAPQKIYQSAGENTISYLKIFLQISQAIETEQEKKANDENFKKYLAE